VEFLVLTIEEGRALVVVGGEGGLEGGIFSSHDGSRTRNMKTHHHRRRGNAVVGKGTTPLRSSNDDDEYYWTKRRKSSVFGMKYSSSREQNDTKQIGGWCATVGRDMRSRRRR
jgi:hypothetical protein